MGHWPATGCDINRFFRPQNLVFAITLCGDFARPPDIFGRTCEGQCYLDFVIQDPGYYSNAYFDIAYVKVLSTEPSSSTDIASSPAASRFSTVTAPNGDASETDASESAAFGRSLLVSGVGLGALILIPAALVYLI
ncbi:glycosyl hydrolase family 16 [Coprinopsis cinerea AmutBmut pab1-1]|nr:glycosyl hydrolase family 16 [Coprinopsis cinerea AmutBmut pab1-1]